MKNKYFDISFIGLISVILSFFCFCLGLWLPILSTKQRIFGITLKYQEVKVTDSIKLFFESGDYLFSFIIVLFVIVTPIIKYIYLFINFSHSSQKWKFSKHLSVIDKWSMIDIFLVALLLLNFKMNSIIIVMKLRLGTTFIAFSVILRIIATQFLKKY